MCTCGATSSRSLRYVTLGFDRDSTGFAGGSTCFASGPQVLLIGPQVLMVVGVVNDFNEEHITLVICLTYVH